MKNHFIFMLFVGSIAFAQTAELNRNNQSAISFLPGNGNSIFHMAHGLNNDLNISQGTNVGDIDIMTITNYGYIGVGTTNPRSILDVGAYIQNGTLGTVFGRLFEGNDVGDGTYLGVKGYSTQNTEYNGKSFSIVHNFYGNTNSSINFFRGGSLTGGYLTFNTNNNSEKMRITSSGLIGIGTTTPAAKLDVENGDFYIGEEASTNGTRRQLRVYGYDNSAKFYGSMHSNYDDYKRTFDINTNNNVQQIKIDASANSYANIVLNPGASGNIGLGTTNPSYKLDVIGSIRFPNSSYLRTKNSSGSTTRVHGINSSNIEYIGSIDHNVSGTIIGTTSDYLNLRTNGVSAVYIDDDQNVGIGTTNTQDFKLGVQGKIAAEEVKVATYDNWSDFVFEKDYNLLTLKEVEKHIKEKGHLKDIPNAEEVKKDGFYLAEMDAKLLRKIEELTLYTIEQEKEIKSLKEENKELKALSNRIAVLEQKLNKK